MIPHWNYPLLLDGATGTELIAAGMPETACPELWTSKHPSVITSLQQQYLQAGCQVLYTPTFGANRARLKPFGLENRVREMNRQLTSLTREAAASCPDSPCLIAGCLSPTGLKPEPAGKTPLADLEDIYDEQSGALKEAGVDLLVCETMTSLSEARAALFAARKTGLPVIVTLTVDREGRTLSGTRLLPAVITLQSLGAAAVGLNCSFGPSCMAEPLAETLRYASVPLVAKPNTMAEGGALSPADFAKETAALLDAGASIIGGCCGASPEHMRELKKEMAKHSIAAPREIDTNACAVESEAFFLIDDLNFSDPIPCESDLADHLIEAEDNANAALIELTSEGDIGNLLKFGNMSRLPLALHTDNAKLLENALYRFPGRLLVDSLCEISRPLLETITSRYGAILY